MKTKRALLITVLLLAPFSQVQAQSGRAPWSLISVRYDTRTSDFIYALYGYGSTFGMVGALHNPRSDWSELLVAAGRMMTDGLGNSHAIATGVAQTAQLWYGQVYYVPSVHLSTVN